MDNTLLVGILVGVIANLIQDWMANRKIEELVGHKIGQQISRVNDKAMVFSIVVYMTIHLRDEHEEEFHTVDQIAHPIAELVEHEMGLE